MFLFPNSSSSETSTDKHRDHEAASWASTPAARVKLCRLCTKPVEAQDSSFLPVAREMCLSYTATFCSHKAGKGWGRGGLLMPHVYLAFCTQGNSFWNSNSLQTASHTWGSLNPVYKISPWAVLTSKQHHRKDTSAKVENGALNKK